MNQPMQVANIAQASFARMSESQLTNSQSTSHETTLQQMAWKGLLATSCMPAMQLDIACLSAFLDAVAAEYSSLAFHNIMHARDVLGKVVILLLANTSPPLSRMQKCALIIGAVVHDLGHVGLTNIELIRSKHPLAVKHPVSPMESHHYERFLDLFHTPGLDFMRAYSVSQQEQFAELVKQIVLSTDISSKSLSLQDGDFTEAEPRMKLLMRCADIGHCGAPWHLHFRWAEKLCRENNDKNGFMSGEFKRDQMSFMKKVACPTFQKLAAVMPDTQLWYANCLANTDRWEGTVPPDAREPAKGVERESLYSERLQLVA